MTVVFLYLPTVYVFRFYPSLLDITLIKDEEQVLCFCVQRQGEEVKMACCSLALLS